MKPMIIVVSKNKESRRYLHPLRRNDKIQDELILAGRFFKKKQYEKSLKFIYQALEDLKKIEGEDKEELKFLAYEGLSKIYQKQNNHKKAILALLINLKSLKESKYLLPKRVYAQYTEEDLIYNLGFSYTQNKEYSLGLSFYNRLLNRTFPKETLYRELIITYQKIINNNIYIYKDWNARQIFAKGGNFFGISLKENEKNQDKIYSLLVNLIIFEALLIEANSNKELQAIAVKIYKYTLETSKSFLDKDSQLLSYLYTKITLYSEDHMKKIYFKKALKCINSSSNKNYLSLVQLYSDLGDFYGLKEEWEQSHYYYSKSFKFSKKLTKNLKEPPNIEEYLTKVLIKNFPQKKDFGIYKKSKIDKKLSLASRNNQYFGKKYYLQKKYKKAFLYAQNSFDYIAIEDIDKKKSDNNIDEMIVSKYKQLNNESPFLNKLSLLMRIANDYKNHSKTSEKTAKEIIKSTFHSWLSYKGILDNRENKLYKAMQRKNSNQDEIYKLKKLKFLLIGLYNKNSKENSSQIKLVENKIKQSIHNLYKNKNLFQPKKINHINISNILKKNQLYIDFVSGSQNYYIFTLDSKNNITFDEISKYDTALINKNIHLYQNINQQFAKAIKNENLSDKLENKLKRTTQKHLSALEEIILKKYLLKQLKQKKSLIISPDGLLNFLPFEALYHNGKYLIEDYKISYISSGREFVRQTKREPYVLANRKMICFGNPDFNASLPINQIKGRFGGTNQVVEETWEQFKDFRPIGNAEIVTIRNLYKNALIYEDKKATVENLMKVDGSQILHLSTHGKFLNSKSIENPMLKAGLAFSGANDRTTLSGIVTALKISALDLQDTELVVLSACESGLGEVQNAEGVMGLPKAFLQAGARNVMMSLWSVSTQKTAMLMKSFYKNVQNGQDYETALRNAKLEMIEMHPYYWSAFIMHGIQN
jgi:CHAT domain-containing protein